MNSHQYLLGFDVGSSSVKASLVNAVSGTTAATAHYPEHEAPIKSVKTGWAEQDPQQWWEYAKLALRQAMAEASAKGDEIVAIGISYQMHGLVCIDKEQRLLRDAIIWCDSRAVPYGEQAFNDLGADWCLSHLLNSPGNFTASKLAWVKENEPQIFDQIDKIMLPGDYIAMKLTGEVQTTIGGLSEAMLWDFKEKLPARFLLDYFGFPESLLPEIVPAFAVTGEVTKAAADELGLEAGIPVSYRAGDQPNNAVSLNVFNPGEIASTAGTSGVVYGVSGQEVFDPKGRVNVFAHANYLPSPSTFDPSPSTHLGVLLCTNGAGILNAWIHRNIAPKGIDYAAMNDLCITVPIGSDGVSIIPFGNGAERVLENREVGCSIHGLNFNRHDSSHLIRAAQEGIAFSFCYGMEIMRAMGMDIRTIRAGQANMFLSPIFRNTLASITGVTIELCNTDGSVGAARGAGIGAGIYSDHQEAFVSLKKLQVIEPDTKNHSAYREAYEQWLNTLNSQLIIHNR